MTNTPEKAALDPNGFIQVKPNQYVDMSINHSVGTIKHLFDTDDIKAINTALACNRPLLLTGEPGIGKSQLARAAAIVLGRAYVRHTVDAKTEPGDLLWQFDAIARLANAQIAQNMGWDATKCEEQLAIHQYIRPGPLWWGLNWKSAKEQPGAVIPPINEESCNPQNGVVVLIDEIDKAEIDVPNGLLEVLGDGSFQPQGMDQRIVVGEVAPLIVLTSNRERALPDAFVRRCVVIQLQLPEPDRLLDWLVCRGQAHCCLDPDVITRAAQQFIDDRQAALEANLNYQPGLAEFLDLLHAIDKLSRHQEQPKQKQQEMLEMTRRFILQKGQAL